MRRITFLLFAAIIAVAVNAREPQRGYRGFVEWDNNITSYNFYDGKETCWFTGVSTSHGFQFNPHLFAGAGLMIEKCTKFDTWTLPLFAQVRTDQTWGKFTPFGDLRLGYNCTDGGGIYLSPTIGYRFNFGRKLNLNFGAGMTLRGQTVEKYNIDINESASEVTITYMGKSHQTKGMFTIRVGIDF